MEGGGGGGVGAITNSGDTSGSGEFEFPAYGSDWLKARHGATVAMPHRVNRRNWKSTLRLLNGLIPW